MPLHALPGTFDNASPRRDSATTAQHSPTSSTIFYLACSSTPTSSAPATAGPESSILWRTAPSTGNLNAKVSTSTTESELIALSEASKPFLWIRNLLAELGFDLPASPVYEDNDSAVQLATAESGSSRSRHIHPRHMWTRQPKDYDIIRITKIATEENLADYLTKILKISTQERIIDRLVRSTPN